MKRFAWLMLSLMWLAACDSDAGKPPLTREELLNPESCKSCHLNQYNEWSGSMHAYASKDPVFRAMNARGQEQAQLGEFCVNCHAPMAVREGATTDGLNLDDVPDHLQGVTCYFCHNAVSIEKDHFNGKLTLANDNIMRAALGAAASSPQPAVAPYAHGVAYSANHDNLNIKSSRMCGTCHDIVTPNHVHLERTLDEYEKGLFSKPGDGFLSCQNCHMKGKQGVAADYPNVPLRTVHEHLWPGVDVPLTDFPNAAAMRSAVEKCELAFGIQSFNVDVPQPGRVNVILETAAGHSMPSGSAQDRRMWLEVFAYDANDKLMFKSGDIADDELEEYPVGHPKHDKQLCMFRDRLYDADGNETHNFWDATRFDSKLMPTAVTPVVGSHTVMCPYGQESSFGSPARMTVRVRMRPMGLDVLQDLVDSKHLDAAIMAKMPTYTVYSAEIIWDDPSNAGKWRIIDTNETDCKSYKCMLDPKAAGCDAETSSDASVRD